MTDERRSEADAMPRPDEEAPLAADRDADRTDPPSTAEQAEENEERAFESGEENPV